MLLKAKDIFVCFPPQELFQRHQIMCTRVWIGKCHFLKSVMQKTQKNNCWKVPENTIWCSDHHKSRHQQNIRSGNHFFWIEHFYSESKLFGAPKFLKVCFFADYKLKTRRRKTSGSTWEEAHCLSSKGQIPKLEAKSQPEKKTPIQLAGETVKVHRVTLNQV